MIGYRIIKTPLGEVLLGKMDGKICFCHFALPSLEAALQRVEADFPGEEIVCREEQPDVQGAGTLEQLLQGRHTFFRWEDFHIKGTSLQVAVWREIFNLLPCELISYSALAARCGYPRAVRSVATAVGKNPISLIIPCHRVLRREAFPKGCAEAGSICKDYKEPECVRVESVPEESGKKECGTDGGAEMKRNDCLIDKEKLGNYEWGKELKRRILEWEGLI